MQKLAKVFQIYYNDDQKSRLLDGFSHFKNTRNNMFVENAVLMRAFNKIKDEDFQWFGGFSHKVHSKIVGDLIEDIIEYDMMAEKEFRKEVRKFIDRAVEEKIFEDAMSSGSMAQA